MVDPSQAEAESVIVRYTAPNTQGTLTLTQWGTPGVFQFSQTVAGADYTGWSSTFIEYKYAGIDAACQPLLNSTKTTITGP
ncbi:MAG: hypothetical protein HQK86_02365 [Nitrospinae bacterium]|nr:hypothetical protein [Nitrospinota bacterium]